MIHSFLPYLVYLPRLTNAKLSSYFYFSLITNHTSSLTLPLFTNNFSVSLLLVQFRRTLPEDLQRHENLYWPNSAPYCSILADVSLCTFDIVISIIIQQHHTNATLTIQLNIVIMNSTFITNTTSLTPKILQLNILPHNLCTWLLPMKLSI